MPRLHLVVQLSFQGSFCVVLGAFRQMITLDHLRNLHIVFEYPHSRNLELRCFPAFRFLQVHEDTLPGGVVIDNEDRTPLPLDSGEDLMLSHLMIGGQSFLDLGNELVRILDPDHFPRPFNFEGVFHRSCRTGNGLTRLSEYKEWRAAATAARPWTATKRRFSCPFTRASDHPLKAAKNGQFTRSRNQRMILEVLHGFLDFRACSSVTHGSRRTTRISTSRTMP